MFCALSIFLIISTITNPFKILKNLINKFEQAVESLRAIAQEHSPEDLEAHFVPLVIFIYIYIVLTIKIRHPWTEAEFENLSCGLNLSRGSNMVGSTKNCIQCFKI